MPTAVSSEFPRLVDASAPARAHVAHASGIEVFGEGSVGEKVRELVLKSATLRELGFATPRRAVLAEGWLEQAMRYNHLGSLTLPGIADVELAVRIGTMKSPRTHLTELAEVIQRMNSPVLAVRSSAEGDARGSGTYVSEFVSNDLESVCAGIRAVLAGYFSPNAVAFRRDVKLPDGFGVMIEPMVGEWIDNRYFPLLSGFGYSSTPREGTYLSMVPGLGGGVDRRDGERITDATVSELGADLGDYIMQSRLLLSSRPALWRPSALRRIVEGQKTERSYRVRGHAPGSVVSDMRVDLSPYFAGLHFKGIDLREPLSMLRRAEDSFGVPQYLEWAMTKGAGKPTYWAIQIAGVSPVDDPINFADLGKVLFEGTHAVGGGDRLCKGAIVCFNPHQVEALHEFNKTHSDYLLFFSSRLISSQCRGIRHLEYADFSNAAALIEIQDSPHRSPPLAHFGGQIELSGKLFSVLDQHGAFPPAWQLFDRYRVESFGMEYLPAVVRVVSSSREGRMLVADADDVLR